MNSSLEGMMRHNPHFLARIDIYPSGPMSTQRNSPAKNGIRWAFCFEEDYEALPRKNPLSICDIWPEFLDENGNTIVDDRPLIGVYNAKMHIIVEDNAEKYLARLRENPKFYCVEIFAVAVGVVIDFL